MPDFPFTIADLAIVGILLVSAVLAFARGFVHEVLSMAAWIGAAFAVVFGLPYARPIARQFISLPLLADVAAGGVIFIVALLIAVAAHPRRLATGAGQRAERRRPLAGLPLRAAARRRAGVPRVHPGRLADGALASSRRGSATPAPGRWSNRAPG